MPNNAPGGKTIVFLDATKPDEKIFMQNQKKLKNSSFKLLSRKTCKPQYCANTNAITITRL